MHSLVVTRRDTLWVVLHVIAVHKISMNVMVYARAWCCADIEQFRPPVSTLVTVAWLSVN
jgi:hypothetical protein